MSDTHILSSFQEAQQCLAKPVVSVSTVVLCVLICFTRVSAQKPSTLKASISRPWITVQGSISDSSAADRDIFWRIDLPDFFKREDSRKGLPVNYGEPGVAVKFLGNALLESRLKELRSMLYEYGIDSEWHDKSAAFIVTNHLDGDPAYYWVIRDTVSKDGLFEIQIFYTGQDTRVRSIIPRIINSFQGWRHQE